MHKVLHVGLSGGSNIGDEAITECIKRIFETQGDIEYSFFKLNYSATKAIKNGKIQGSKARKFLRKYRFIKLFYELILPFLKWRYYIEFYKKAKRADVIVFGGGNIVMDIDILFPLHLFILSSLSKFSNSKVGLIVAGVGPIKTKLGGFICNAFVKKLTFAIVRDELSRNTLESLGYNKKITIICDPVFYIRNLFEYHQGVPQQNKAIISVFPFGTSRVSHDSNISDYNEYLKLLCRIYDELKEKGYEKISILVTDIARDSAVAIELSNLRDFESIFQPHTVKELCKIICNTSFLVSTRMHPSIIAANYNIPFIALAWQDKVVGCLNSVSLHNRAFDIRSYLNTDSIPDLSEAYLNKPNLSFESYVKKIVGATK